MALRINLYHEVLRAKRQRQYDPLRLTMLAMIVVAAGMAFYYFVQMARTNSAKSKHATQKAEYEKLLPQKAAAEKREAELTKQIDLAEKLTNRMEKRIYWAPLFEAVMAAVPENVQITKLSCDTGRDKGGVGQITIEGIAADIEPRAVAEDLRKNVAARVGAKYPNASAAFRSMDDGTDHPVVNGKRMMTVVFTIAVTFRAEPEPAAPAAPAPSRRARGNTASL